MTISLIERFLYNLQWFSWVIFLKETKTIQSHRVTDCKWNTETTMRWKVFAVEVLTRLEKKKLFNLWLSSEILIVYIKLNYNIDLIVILIFYFLTLLLPSNT